MTYDLYVDVKRETKGIKVIISTCFVLDSEELIKEYKSSLQMTNFSIPLDVSFKNPFSPYNIIRVLLHRKDKVAKAFFQKLKIKNTFSKLLQ